jgi:nucleoside-diphosphate-sugar epimerase
VRIFLAGATGAIGKRLVPMLLDAGHQVTGMTRSASKVEQLRAAGADAVVCDALDAPALHKAVAEAEPEAVIHELTALPERLNPRKIERDFVLNDRLRSEGTRLLVAAAQAAGAQRIVAQSIAFAYAPGPPGTLHSERDPLMLEEAPKTFKRTVQALADLESTVLGAGGVVLRYGYIYGPGTSISSDGSIVEDLRSRKFPIVGKGTGVWSFVHVDDAARATVKAVEHDGSGVYNVVDDDPAPMSEWMPALAAATDAPSPMRIPTLLARVVAGNFGVSAMTRSQGAANALAKRELCWEPQHASWRDGFRTALG